LLAFSKKQKQKKAEKGGALGEKRGKSGGMPGSPLARSDVCKKFSLCPKWG